MILLDLFNRMVGFSFQALSEKIARQVLKQNTMQQPCGSGHDDGNAREPTQQADSQASSVNA
ncbi:hypothetical protein Q671_12635 [Halomonas sp. PBN3]|nr:hypothetical protein Q671_12635 [Halomonas sp. PBN3]